MPAQYLCYDLKGIQSFIFSIPRLRYIIGGSALLDRFDRERVPGLTLEGARRLFSGGGKGAFLCDDDAATDRVQQILTEAAHEIGAGIAFGRDAEYSEAAHHTTVFFPCLPPGGELEGSPCRESGLYPVSDDGQEHRLVRMRIFQRGDPVFRHFEARLLEGLELPPTLGDAERADFFHDVSRDADDPTLDSDDDARAGAAALGNRNRWAVICMDGNDMGQQFRKRHKQFRKQHKEAPAADSLIRWLEASSGALDEVTRGACSDAVLQVIKHWCRDVGDGVREATSGDTVCLPIRPLLVGGDDVVVLCHCSYAFDFVREAFRSFGARAHEASEAWREEHGEDLWSATGGQLSISAGILFAPVSLPLATAIPYAESLLASAKHHGRQDKPDGAPAPACVDWESVTSSVIDHPALSRQRQLVFQDDDEDVHEVVELTRRPYTLEKLGTAGDDLDTADTLEALATRLEELPTTILHQVLPAMRAGYWDRRVWLARLAKSQGELVRALSDAGPGETKGRKGSRWRFETREGEVHRSTDVLDAIDILTERSRMTRDTVEG